MICKNCNDRTGLRVQSSEHLEDGAGVKEEYECAYCGLTGWYESDGINHRYVGILAAE